MHGTGAWLLAVASAVASTVGEGGGSAAAPRAPGPRVPGSPPPIDRQTGAARGFPGYGVSRGCPTWPTSGANRPEVGQLERQRLRWVVQLAQLAQLDRARAGTRQNARDLVRCPTKSRLQVVTTYGSNCSASIFKISCPSWTGWTPQRNCSGFRCPTEARSDHWPVGQGPRLDNPAPPLGYSPGPLTRSDGPAGPTSRRTVARSMAHPGA